MKISYDILSIKLILKLCQTVMRKPFNSLTFSSILCLKLKVYLSTKTFGLFLISLLVSFGLGRDKGMCVILDSVRLLNRVILQYGVKFLGGSQRAMSLPISISFLSIIICLITFIDFESRNHLCVRPTEQNQTLLN